MCEEAMSNINSDKWLEAIKSKMNSMGSNQVWALVDLLKGVKPVGCKWVCKRKFGANKEVTAFKARFVAKGYTQRPGVDFEKTYSSVAISKSIRILLAIAAWYDYEICQMNVKTAFLSDFIEEEIFIDQSEGFTSVGEEQEVYRLQRSIYDIKQAFRSWNTHFDEVIRGYDFIMNKHDPCVYKKISGSSVAYLVLYVDEILLNGDDIKMLGDIKACLSTQFSMKDMDVAYALSVTSRYQACTGEAHWSAFKTILKYLRKTKDMFLIYSGGELILKGYNGASFQSDDDDAKSQLGFVFKLNGGVVAWKSSKQATIADSTTESEYVAALEVAKEAVCIEKIHTRVGCGT
ncbi:UNVERIFIED_CONTAM: Retrovirus-related Pol polyprotein from transposon RE2 [Sesamum radiatum]|uniref:Retrovirus-related Pol polyprotein from transposon RE2 n=1 Tax=Sesamum radiatum TaxID=300843 RepID=A0AAW2WMC1_SESRA